MQRLPLNCTETFRRRFIKSWEDYVTSVAHQAEDRSKSHIPDLESFIQLRRLSSGGYPTVILYEMDLEIPDDVRRDPTIMKMETLSIELICIVNVSGKSDKTFINGV